MSFSAHNPLEWINLSFILCFLIFWDYFSKFQNDSEHVFEIVGDTCCKLEHHRKSILEIGSNLHFLSLCQVSHHQDPSQML
tara:strand:- start:1672 stop:1914 length:243 start_codon:yes stop_codon:yes gene_type:complete